jgi:hypothetical protein
MCYDVDFLGFSFVLVGEYVLFISFLVLCIKLIYVHRGTCVMLLALWVTEYSIFSYLISNQLKLRDSGRCTKGNQVNQTSLSGANSLIHILYKKVIYFITWKKCCELCVCVNQIFA